MTDILKIIPDNAANRATGITGTIAATPIAPGMSAASMLTDVASDVCRGTGTSMSIVMTWAAPERIGSWHAPWCNLSPTATVRVRGYSDEAGTAQVLDTGVLPACPAPAARLLGRWNALTSASAYAYGGGAHAAAWFANTPVRRLVVDLADVDNVQGYIEVSRVFAGEWWSPAKNADWGPTLSSAGAGTSFRDRAGRRRTTRGAQWKKMGVSLTHMTEADRAAMWALILGNGTEVPFIFSLYPNDPYPARERAHQMYCFLAATGTVRRSNFAEHGTELELESV